MFEDDCIIEQSVVLEESEKVENYEHTTGEDEIIDLFSGMEFTSLDEVESYYNKFVKGAGFSVQKI